MRQLSVRVAWGATLVALCLVLSPSLVRAQSLEPEEIPPALRPWVPWVLADQATYGCTAPESAASADASGDPICVWPALLRVEIQATGASFSMEVTADRAYELSLPGSGRVWPIDVRVDGHATPVVADEDTPVVFIEAGAHRVEGRIPWTTIPDTLDVPPDVARVLVVRGATTTEATRDTDGAVWLHAPAAEDDDEEAPEAEEADSVSFEVFRQLTDGAPMELVTRISVHVGGHPRELRLGDVLPDGAVPVAVDATLATRLTAAGELTLQLHAGTYSVEIRALVADPAASLGRPALPPPWPTQEVWVWVPNEAFRQVELSGPSSVDPARTSLPSEWQSYSAYLVDGAAPLALETLRRGEPTPPPNALSVNRTLWLDESGGGATVSDTLSLTLHDGFRISLEEGELGRVSIDGHDQLITHGGEGDRPGVEVRTTSTTLLGEWRMEGGLSSFPAVGWSEDAQSVSTTLNLPPGWLLLHASGVDDAPGSWTSQWTLLGFFALLLVTIVVGRVFGPAWGAAAFVGVGLAYYEPDAPRWIWVVLAVLLALHRALGARALAPWVARLYLLVLVVAAVVAVSFAADQTRLALHPTLAHANASYETVEEETPEWLQEQQEMDDAEGGTGKRHRDEEGAMGEESHERTSSRYGIEGPEDNPDPHMAREQARDDAWGSGSSLSSSDVTSYGWMDPSTVVQTGFGCPTWSWWSYALVFDGPVGRDHRVDLWLSPPWLTMLAGLLRAGLALALLFVSIRSRPGASGTTPASPATATAGAAAAALALFALLPTSVDAQATAPMGPIPSSEMLTELENRLAWTPECGDHCAEADRMRISVHGDVLAIDLDMGVTATSAYPLPGPSETWVPSAVTIDGQAAHALARLSSSFIHVRIPAGAHTVHAEGSVAGRDAITLSLGRAPRSIEITTVGWETDGSGTGPHVPESIQLRRSVPATPAAPEDGTDEPTDDTDTTGTETPVHATLPSWLVVDRRLDLGVRWTIQSTLTRRSPATSADVVRVPLLPGESVTDAAVVVEGGNAVVSLGQHDAQVTWTSTLQPTPEIVLSAPAEGRVSERWTVACTPLWHCDTSGLAPTESASSSRWEPRFDPWPGETLTVTTARPGPLEGRSTTIDEARISFTPGARLSTATLDASVRTSVSAPLAITLPSGSDVRSLTVDGQSRPIQTSDGALSVTLQPGSHSVRVEWQTGDGWSAVLSTPHVTLGDAVVNLTLDVDGSDDRWLLFLSGPRWGPAILIWPYAGLVLVLAYALSRRRELLPTLADWILLGLGLTQVSSGTALVVVGWFFVMEWRRTRPIEGAIGFDARQLAIATYTLVACSALVGAIRQGLLGTPGMDVEGPGTYGNHLHFFVDRSDGVLPEATIITLPVLVFRVLMFAWAAWLAFAVVRWARRGWTIFGEGGLWRSITPGHPPMAAAPAESPTADAAPAAAASAETTSSEASSPPPEEAPPPAEIAPPGGEAPGPDDDA